MLFSEEESLEFVPLTSISAKLLNLFKYCKEFLNISLLKLKKLSKILVDTTLTLEALFELNLPFVIA